MATVQSNELVFQLVEVMGQPPKRANRSVKGFNPTVSRASVFIQAAYMSRAWANGRASLAEPVASSVPIGRYEYLNSFGQIF